MLVRPGMRPGTVIDVSNIKPRTFTSNAPSCLPGCEMCVDEPTNEDMSFAAEKLHNSMIDLGFAEEEMAPESGAMTWSDLRSEP